MRAAAARRWIEGCLAGAAVAASSLFFPQDPAFMGLGFMPQAFVALLVSAFLGSGPGLASLAMAAGGSLALPLLAVPLGPGQAWPDTASLAATGRIPGALALLGVAAAGFLRDADLAMAKRYRGRISELIHRNSHLEKVNEALASLNEGLERRVSGERDSISALHARIRKMDSPLVETVLNAILEAVAGFSRATALAIHEFDAKERVLIRTAWTGDAPAERLGLDDSVEGWVFRSDSPFTLRRLDEYLGLDHIEAGRTVIAFPLKAGDLPWGVISVREMPFYRYNPVTERNIEVVVELSAPYLRRAVDAREKALARPRNAVTGLPGHAELLPTLAAELGRRAEKELPLSIVIVEILDYAVIDEAHPDGKALTLVKGIVDAAGKKGKTRAFHSRRDGQVAFILPDLDRAGASIFCLELSTALGEKAWSVEGSLVCFETAFGIASWPSLETLETIETLEPLAGDAEAGPLVEGPDPELLAKSLLDEAESILAISKSAFAEHGRCG